MTISNLLGSSCETLLNELPGQRLTMAYRTYLTSDYSNALTMLSIPPKSVLHSWVEKMGSKIVKNWADEVISSSKIIVPGPYSDISRLSSSKAWQVCFKKFQRFESDRVLEVGPREPCMWYPYLGSWCKKGKKLPVFEWKRVSLGDDITRWASLSFGYSSRDRIVGSGRPRLVGSTRCVSTAIGHRRVSFLSLSLVLFYRQSVGFNSVFSFLSPYCLPSYHFYLPCPLFVCSDRAINHLVSFASDARSRTIFYANFHARVCYRPRT